MKGDELWQRSHTEKHPMGGGKKISRFRWLSRRGYGTVTLPSNGFETPGAEKKRVACGDLRVLQWPDLSLSLNLSQ